MEKPVQVNTTLPVMLDATHIHLSDVILCQQKLERVHPSMLALSHCGRSRHHEAGDQGAAAGWRPRREHRHHVCPACRCLAAGQWHVASLSIPVIVNACGRG